MCDWEAEEYAEYLLWVEAERAHVRSRARSEVRATEPLETVAAPPVSAEA